MKPQRNQVKQSQIQPQQTISQDRLSNIPGSIRNVIYGKLSKENAGVLKTTSKFFKQNVQINKNTSQEDIADDFDKQFTRLKFVLSKYPIEIFENNINKVVAIGIALKTLLNVPQNFNDTAVRQYFKRLIKCFKTLMRDLNSTLYETVDELYSCMTKKSYYIYLGLYAERDMNVTQICEQWKLDDDEKRDLVEDVEKIHEIIRAEYKDKRFESNNNSFDVRSYDTEGMYAHLSDVLNDDGVIASNFYLQLDFVSQHLEHERFCLNAVSNEDEVTSNLNRFFETLQEITMKNLHLTKNPKIVTQLLRVFDQTNYYFEDTNSQNSNSKPSQSQNSNPKPSQLQNINSKPPQQFQKLNGLVSFLESLKKIYETDICDYAWYNELQPKRKISRRSSKARSNNSNAYSQNGSESQTQHRSRSQVQSNAQSRTQSQSRSQVQSQAQSKSQSRSQSQSQSQSQARSKVQSQAQSQSQGQVQPLRQIQPQAQPQHPYVAILNEILDHNQNKPRQYRKCSRLTQSDIENILRKHLVSKTSFCKYLCENTNLLKNLPNCMAVIVGFCKNKTNYCPAL